jgi:hypothetical protein
MARRDLLPGVVDDACPPAVVFNSRRAIRRARIYAALRDLGQLSLLGGLDYYYMTRNVVHLPWLQRDSTGVVLAAFHAAVITQMFLTRVIPQWRAKRIARTWRLAERTRFFATK